MSNIEINVEPARRAEKEKGYDWTIEIAWSKYQASILNFTNEQFVELISKGSVHLPKAIKNMKEASSDR